MSQGGSRLDALSSPETVFEYPVGVKFRTGPEERQQVFLEGGAESYLLFTHSSGH